MFHIPATGDVNGYDGNGGSMEAAQGSSEWLTNFSRKAEAKNGINDLWQYQVVL
jgi:hypothetical protein